MKKKRDFYFKKYKPVEKSFMPDIDGMNMAEQALRTEVRQFTFCSAASILLFRMDRTGDFFKSHMSEYVSKESVNPEFGLTIFDINLEKLDGHYYEGWKPEKTNFLSYPGYYLSDKSIRVVVGADDFGAIITSEDVHYDYNNKREEISPSADFLKELSGELKEEIRKPINPEISCAEHLFPFFSYNDRPGLKPCYIKRTDCVQKESEENEIVEGDPRFFNTYNVATSYLSCLLDIIINEKLQKRGCHRKIDFIVPKETSYRVKEYKAGAWGVYEDLVHTFGLRNTIRFIYFRAAATKKNDEKKKMMEIFSKLIGEKFNGEGALKSSGLSANGLCSFALEGTYTEYSHSPDPEDSLLALVAANLLRAELIVKEEKYIAAMHNIKKIHDKDVADVYKYITEIKATKATMSLGFQGATAKSIFIRWLTITNTKVMLDDAEDIAKYIVSEVERKTEKTSQVLLNFIAALTVISAINDLLSMGYESNHTPLGIIIALFSVVLVALVGVTFFSNLNGRKSKYIIISFILILLFVIAKYGGLFSGIGRFLGESIVYLRNTFLLQH